MLKDNHREAIAEAKKQFAGNPEVLAKITALEEESDTTLIEDALAKGKTFGKHRPVFKDENADRNAQFEKAISELKDKGQDDYAAKVEALYAQEKFDQSDSTEEFRGLAAIPAENLTFGLLGDEARAAGRAGLMKVADFFDEGDIAGSFQEEYEMALEDERRVEAKVYHDMPVVAHGLGIAYGLVAGGATAKAAGVGKSTLEGIARQGLAGGAEAGTYGFMEGEGLENRLDKAAKFGALGATLGGAVGGYGGRQVVKGKETAARIKKEQAAMKVEDARMGAGKDIGDPSDLYDLAEPVMRGKAAKHYNQTGKPLTGPAMTGALKETAQELGVSIRRLRQAETSRRGSIFNYEGKTAEDLIAKNADDFYSSDISRAILPWHKKIMMDGIRPLVKKAELQVGKPFAGKVQRLATRMAQDGDDITRMFHTVPVKSFQTVLRNLDGSGQLRSALLNMSNIHLKQSAREGFERRAVSILKEKGGDQAVQGFREMQEAVLKGQRFAGKTTNKFLKEDRLYWPSQAKANKSGLKGITGGKERATQQNLKAQQRKIIKPHVAREVFEAPDVVLDEWLRKSYAVSRMHDEFGLMNLGARAEVKKGKPLTKKQIEKVQRTQAAGQSSFEELQRRLMLEGAEEGTAEAAVDLVSSLVVTGHKGPNSLISNFRKAAYMGTIGNPYSAVLNVGDTFNSMVNFGAANTATSIVDAFRKNGLKITVDDVGMMHQTTGEFIRDGVGAAQRRFNAASEKTFTLSGFRAVDRFGKNVAMNAALKNNRALAAEGLPAFEKRWGFAFKDHELRQLHKDVLNGDTTQLVKELAAAELSKLQPTDMANLPQWFLDHPNARVLYMLRTFGLKQIQQMENLVFDTWKAGDKKKAVQNALAYSVVVGGGNSAVNEARQTMKGDMPTMDGWGMRWADHMLGAASANTLGLYSIGRAVEEKNATHLASGAMPPLAMAFAPLLDLLLMGDWAVGDEPIDVKEAMEDSEMVGWLPFGRLMQNWLKETD